MPIRPIRPDIAPRARIRTTPAAVQPATAPAGKPDYEVGYSRPPKHTRFKPGQSGNPRGRPKGAKGLNTIAHDVLTEKVTLRTAVGPKRVSKMEAALHKLMEKGFSGDLRALTASSSSIDRAFPMTCGSKRQTHLVRSLPPLRMKPPYPRSTS